MGSEHAKLGELLDVLFALREVVPFEGIGFNVVEFFVAIGVVKIAPIFRAHAIAARLVEVGERGVLPGRGGVFEKRDQVASVVVFFVWNPRELGESGKEVEEVYRLIANRAGGGSFGKSGSAVFWKANHERDPGDSTPSREFLPVLF